MEQQQLLKEVVPLEAPEAIRDWETVAVHCQAHDYTGIPFMAHFNIT